MRRAPLPAPRRLRKADRDKPARTNCQECSREIAADEAQMCGLCGRDGLGNCCIGTMDHDCEMA